MRTSRLRRITQATVTISIALLVVGVYYADTLAMALAAMGIIGCGGSLLLTRQPRAKWSCGRCTASGGASTVSAAQADARTHQLTAHSQEPGR